jgi:hypothetical protein
MPNAKIKISAPRENPHICYVGRDYEQKIKDIKKETGMSLYTLLCTCSGYLLNEKESIKNFKDSVRKNGFRNIGEWAEALIDLLHESLENINVIDLSSIHLKKESDKDVQHGD